MTTPYGYYCPGASSGAEPAVDERLAPPETRVEYLDGAEVYAAPADEDHGVSHADLGFLVRAHSKADRRTAVDMLTRVDETTDVAPDLSVYPSERDAKTGGRQLEEVVFEVCDRQALGIVTKKARALVNKGVRRVFCVRPGPGQVLEWNRETDGWATLARDQLIDDVTFVRPIPVAAILDGSSADDCVARALLDKHLPSLLSALQASRDEGLERGLERGLEQGLERGLEQGLERGLEQGLERGLEQGLRQGVLDLCEVLNIPVDAARLGELQSADEERLRELREHIKAHRTWPR